MSRRRYLDKAQSSVDTFEPISLSSPAMENRLRLISDDRFPLYRLNPHFLITPLDHGFTSPGVEFKKIRCQGYSRWTYSDYPIHPMTVYQPFYPNSYYPIWEILYDQKLLTDQTAKVVLIDTGDLGALEASHNYLEAETMNEKCSITRIPIGKTSAPKKFTEQFEYETHSSRSSSCAVLDNYYQNHRIDAELVFCLSRDHLKLASTLNQESGNLIYHVHDRLQIHNLDTTIFLWYESFQLIVPTVSHPLNRTGYFLLKNRLSHPQGEMAKNRIEAKMRKIRDNQIIQYYQDYLRYCRLSLCDSVAQEKNIATPKWTDLEESPLLVGAGITWCQQYHIRLSTRYCQNRVPKILHPKKFSMSLAQQNLNFLEKGKKQISPKNSTNRYSLQKLQCSLNRYQRLIKNQEHGVRSDYNNNLINWEHLIDCINPYRHLDKILRWRYSSEECSPFWIQMYELFETIELFDTEADELSSLHLSALPGETITALHHYLATQTKITGNRWTAHDLNPKAYENRDSNQTKDRYALRGQHPDHWFYGSDKTGRLETRSQILSFQEHFSDKDLDLIISRCNDLAHLMVVLTTLPIGKTAVFNCPLTLTQPWTLSQLYILSSIFKSVQIFKPHCSPVEQNTVFIICQNYSGLDIIPRSLLDHLWSCLESNDSSVPLVDLDLLSKSFIDEMVSLSRNLIEKQIDWIKYQLDLRSCYFDDYELQEKITEDREKRLEWWLEKNRLVELIPENRLLQPIRPKPIYQKRQTVKRKTYRKRKVYS